MVHSAQELRRNVRLLIRHIRFFRPWDRENRARMELLHELFRVINRYLRDLGVEYWLAYGTLLGYYREGRIIRHDKDIDIGAHEKEYLKIREGRKRLPAGFKMYDTSYKHRGPKLYVTYKGWEADLYFYEDTGAQLRSYEHSNNLGETTPFPKSYVYPLGETTFLGEKTFIPHQPEALLLHHYRCIDKDALQDEATGYWYPKDPK